MVFHIVGATDSFSHLIAMLEEIKRAAQAMEHTTAFTITDIVQLDDSYKSRYSYYIARTEVPNAPRTN